uniref:KH domain-containing protein n=1 Tax=Angiostrongylus costaricensis TaxID=334426 RepID=A0A0R3PCV5_ANGCS
LVFGSSYVYNELKGALFKVSRRKRKSAVEHVETEVCLGTTSVQHAQRCADTICHRTKRSKGEKGEIRKISVPKHRYTPLKENWVNIFTPIVKNLGLQVRFNIKTRNVEIRNLKDREETTDLQKVRSCSPMFTFNSVVTIADVKSSLKGDNLSRAVGRIAGKDGRTKLVIENVTKTRIVLADTKIHLLGAYQNLKLARNAVCSLILGTSFMIFCTALNIEICGVQMRNVSVAIFQGRRHQRSTGICVIWHLVQANGYKISRRH